MWVNIKTLCWVKQDLHKEECVKWFNLYEILEWVKLFYGEKNPNSDFLGVQE